MRGQYKRDNLVALSEIQIKILGLLDVTTPRTLASIGNELGVLKTASNRVSLTRSFERLASRSLIRSLGKNSKNENLWVKVKK